MKNARTWIVALTAGLALLLPASAMAQPEDTDSGETTGNPETAGEPKANPNDVDDDGDPDDDPDTLGQGHKSENLPEPTSDDDPTPEVSALGMPEGGIVRQAGIGGAVAYARRGVLELGGSAGFSAADGFTQVAIRPSVGWFLVDNLQLSAIMGLNYSKNEGESQTLFTALIEPSFHVPFSQSTFGFLGMGMGLGYVEGPGAGLAIAPRVGANFLVGRSGLLTPAAFMQYTTHDATETPQGTLLAVSTSFGVQLGYTVMW